MGQAFEAADKSEVQKHQRADDHEHGEDVLGQPVDATDDVIRPEPEQIEVAIETSPPQDQGARQ